MGHSLVDFHTGDLVEQYVDYRGPVSQFPVNVSNGDYLDLPTTGQPCATFGLHPSLEKMQTLYQAGDAAFYANVGSLVEPLTVEDWKAGIKRVPRSVGACVAASLVLMYRQRYISEIQLQFKIPTCILS